jgi:protein subunit release factor B
VSRTPDFGALPPRPRERSGPPRRDAARPDEAELAALARDCEITPYRSSGPGGQKKNKTESSVRVRHLPSGITRVATESRSQSRNRRLALERVWLALERRARVRTPRVATAPSRAAVERRLSGKRRDAEKKRKRAHPAAED